MYSKLERESDTRGSGSIRENSSRVSGEEKQERYHDYILRRMREEDRKQAQLTDEEMISSLRTMAHWTTDVPWSQIANRLEELIELERKTK